MNLQRPPPRLVEDGRVVAFGMFAGAVPDPNLADHRPWGPASGLRLKRWQHLAVIHPEVALTFAVVDVGYLRLGWAQVVDRIGGERHQVERKSPWLDVRVAPRLGDDRSWLRSAGLRIELHSHLDAQRHTVELDAGPTSARLHCHADAATPLEVCLPVGRGRALWSHKVPLPVSGTLAWGDRRWSFDPAITTGIFDIHQAHYPRRTWWKWGTFAGVDPQGRRIGVNLTRNVVEDDAFHENALWVDGALSLLPPPAFAVEADPWTARGDGVDVRFAGHGERRESLNAGLLVSRFRQRYGLWDGSVGGHDLRGCWGLAEDHTSVW
jgi:hypothetical protein